MNLKLRNQIWNRNNGTCQKCGKKLTELIDPIKEASNDLANIPEIPVYKWKENCWKCSKETELVTYDIIFL